MNLILSFTVRAQEPWLCAIFDVRNCGVTHSDGTAGRQFPLKGRFMANVFIHFEVSAAKCGVFIVDHFLH